MTAFNACFQAHAYAAQIAGDVQAGSQRGVPPTPGIFVNDVMVHNASAGDNYVPEYTDVASAIDTALAGQ